MKKSVVLLLLVFCSSAFALDPSHANLPFYQTRWFYGFSALFVAFASYGVLKYRQRLMRVRQNELLMMVDQRTRELREAQEQLKHANTDLLQANLTLEQRVREGINALRDAEQMAAYGKLVAGVAHEVRHPVFALQASAYVLREKLKDREDIQPQLNILERETKRMSVLTDDLLEFARPPSLFLGLVYPAALLKEVVEMFQSINQFSSLQIVVDAPENLPVLMMDRSRMVQVFLNLVNNAHKHAVGAKTVRLSAALDEGGKTVSFRVKDYGIGIPPEHLDHIFEPFYTTGKGTGLGLAIVRRIVKDHGAKIQVESTPGVGATFTVVFPVNEEDVRNESGAHAGF